VNTQEDMYGGVYEGNIRLDHENIFLVTVDKWKETKLLIYNSETGGRVIVRHADQKKSFTRLVDYVIQWGYPMKAKNAWRALLTRDEILSLIDKTS